MVIYTFVYEMTVGPVCYALVPEIPAGRLRTRTVVLGRNLYNVINIVVNIIIPYMLNPSAWNWKAKAGFFYAGLCLCCIVWTYFRLPETKGRTYAEIDALFAQGTPAWKFKGASVELFGTGDNPQLIKTEDGDKIDCSHVEVVESTSADSEPKTYL